MWRHLVYFYRFPSKMARRIREQESENRGQLQTRLRERKTSKWVKNKTKLKCNKIYWQNWKKVHQ